MSVGLSRNGAFFALIWFFLLLLGPPTIFCTAHPTAVAQSSKLPQGSTDLGPKELSSIVGTLALPRTLGRKGLFVVCLLLELTIERPLPSSECSNVN